MGITAGSRNRAAAGLAAGLIVTGLVSAMACSDGSAPTTGIDSSPPSTPSTRPTPSPPPTPIVLHVVGQFTSSEWWAGSAYPMSPVVFVTSGATPSTPTMVVWSTTGGGILTPDGPEITDAYGIVAGPTWTLGAPGVNTMTAVVGPAAGSTETLHISFSVVAVPAPARFAEYQLVLVDGRTPPPPERLELDLVGSVLRFGDDGTIEWTETEGGFLGPRMYWGVGRYTGTNGSIAFSQFASGDTSRFPGDSATVVGDTITSTFPVVISIGLDTETVSRTATYVRTSGPPVSALRSWLRGGARP